MELIQEFLDIMKEIYTDNNEEYFKFFISWIRWLIVKPHIKTKVFVFLFSKQGYGKSTITSFLTNYIFGENHSLTTSGLDSVTGKFNSLLAGKVVVNVEELPSTQEQFHNQFDKMKHLISGNTINIEPKGKEHYEIRNYSNFIGCGNNRHALKITSDDERYFVIELKHKKDKSFWKSFYDKFMNQNFGNMFYNYMMTTDDDDYIEFYSRPDIPMTELKEQIIELGVTPFECFLREIENKEYKLENVYEVMTKTKYAIKRKDLFNQFCIWSSANNHPKPLLKHCNLPESRTKTDRYVNLIERFPEFSDDMIQQKPDYMSSPISQSS